jgi:hypothetical protein
MASPTFGDRKSLSFGSKDYGVKGGGDSGVTGPTTSKRSYPKGGATPGNTQDAPFNPKKQPASDIYVGGV